MSTLAYRHPSAHGAWHRARPSRPVLALLAALVVVGASYLLSVGRPAVEDQSGPAVGGLAQIDHSIRAWTANLAANDRDFYAATNLGVLYEARARLTGDMSDYERARVALDRALGIVPTDLTARVLHAHILHSTHDFAGALAEARSIQQENPSQIQAIATVGDASLELGDLRTAADSYATLARLQPGAPVTARQSRLAFISGDPATARSLAEQAYGESSSAGETGATLGWYAYLAGSTNLAVGDPTAARTWFDRALAAWPTGHLPLAGMARAEVALERPDAAIELYRRALAVAPQPDALAALGDLYALRGDATLAEEQYAVVEAIGTLSAFNQQLFNRQLVLFAANHDRDVPNALTMAERELQVRTDVYGYDAYAWALLASGRAREADAAIRQALAVGTQDSLLDYHAGMIALAAGDAPRAGSFLEKALSRPGALEPLDGHKARLALEAVR